MKMIIHFLSDSLKNQLNMPNAWKESCLVRIYAKIVVYIYTSISTVTIILL